MSDDGQPRILSADAVAGATPWRLPEVKGPVVQAGAEVAPPSAAELEAVHEEARREGFELGRREGRERGYREGRQMAEERLAAEAAALEALLQGLAAPLARLDDELEQNLVTMVFVIARHLVRRELRTSPGEVVAVVREALGRLPAAAPSPRIRLHPDDLEVVRSVLGGSDEASGCRLEADPLIERGGCVVETESSYIDATVEARLTALASQALGGARAGEQ